MDDIPTEYSRDLPRLGVGMGMSGEWHKNHGQECQFVLHRDQVFEYGKRHCAYVTHISLHVQSARTLSALTNAQYRAPG